MTGTKSWNVDLIGILADDQYVKETTGKPKSVFINSQNYIQFIVKVISQTPENFPNVKLFNCFSSELGKYGFEDHFQKHDFTREEALREFLHDHLIVFRPYRKTSYNHEEIYQGRDIRLIPKNDSFQENDTLVPLPVFSEEEHQMTYEEFINRIIERKYVGRIEYISTEPNDTPEIVLFKPADGTYRVIGEFHQHHYAHGGFSFAYNEQELRLPIDFQEEWHNHIYEIPDNRKLLFVDLRTYQEMVAAVRASEPFEMQQLSSASVTLHQGNVVPKSLGEAETAAALEISAPAEGTKEERHVHNDVSPASLKEQAFMERFIQVTREMGLQYSEKDLYNFHTCVKSNTLNILAGMSGTGKSKLVQAYARALGLDVHDEQLTIIPVRSSWTDDADLIGYVDSMNMIYRPGDTNLINTLIQAQKEENRHSKLYIVCFDEMNLARVEHYFSQFLSVLEMDENHRLLRLYNDDLTRLYNSAQYPPVIRIGSNILFIGTVNLDESTYHFSDKVLDRANVITLDVLPFEGLRELTKHRESKEKRKSDKPELKTVISYQEFNDFRNPDPSFQLSERETEFLWAVHQALQKISRNLGVGPRIVKQIDQYLKNLPVNPYLGRREAFDLQVVQRILTKLRGPEGLLKPLLGKMDANGENADGKLFELIDQFRDVSDFTKTREVLIQKAKELMTNGFTF